MVEIRQFIPEDYMAINRRQFDLVTFLNFPNPRMVGVNLSRGPAFTMVNSESIIACAGILPVWKGVGEAWAVTSGGVEKVPYTFTKAVWDKLWVLVVALNLERLQTTVHVSHKASIRWVERMGFVREGEMKKYIGGEDFYRYAWVKED